jgi:TonB family protein
VLLAILMPCLAFGVENSEASSIDAPQPIDVESPQALDADAGMYVMVRLTVNTAGEIENTEVTHADAPDFAESVLPGVKQWRFTPVLKYGVAVWSRVLVLFRFADDSSTDAMRSPSKLNEATHVA